MLACHAFRVRIQCSGCRENIPVNHLTSSLECYRCGEVNRLDAETWREELQHASTGAVRVITPRRRGRACEVEATEAAVCPQCDAGFDVAALAAGPAAVACRDGHAIAVWPADPITRAVFPEARFVVGEPVATTAPGAKVTVLACAECGGPLDTDGTQRVAVCAHCNATNVIAGAMSPKSRWFGVVVEDGRAARTDEDRRRDLAVTTSSADKLRELAGDPSPRVRRAVADGPRTPPDALARLADDPDPAIRNAAVANPNFAPAPPTTESKLAAIADPQLTHDALFALAEDPDALVAETAKERIRQMRLTGELPPAHRGFFAKLFGD